MNEMPIVGLCIITDEAFKIIENFFLSNFLLHVLIPRAFP